MRNRSSRLEASTQDREYSHYLLEKGGGRWKRILDAQAPYRWNLRRMKLGFTFDLGCGIGRNLMNLGGSGVGIDHNQYSVEIARTRGLLAFTPDEFRGSTFDVPERFDSILLSHVAEHMTQQDAIRLLSTYTYLLKWRGQVIIITPQEYGHRSDRTHIEFMDFQALRNIARRAGLTLVKEFSFPLPRAFGRFFKYNEFISVSRKLP